MSTAWCPMNNERGKCKKNECAWYLSDYNFKGKEEWHPQEKCSIPIIALYIGKTTEGKGE